MYSHTERTSLGHMGVPEHTPCVHSHKGGGWWSQLWIKCAGGGEMLIAGEKGKFEIK